MLAASNGKRPDNSTWWLLLVYCLGLLLLIFNAVGCNPVQRVLSDKDKFGQVGKEWERLNPCINDTTLEFLHDTTTLLDTKYIKSTDTIRLPGGVLYLRDTLVKYNTRTITRTDIVQDNRGKRILTDTVNHYKLMAANLRGQVTATEQRVDEVLKQRNEWAGYFAALAIITIVLAWLCVKDLPLLKFLKR